MMRDLPGSNMQRFRGGLVCKAHGLLYHSTLGLRVLKKKKKMRDLPGFASSCKLLFLLLLLHLLRG